MDTFYQNLKPFSNFDEITLAHHFQKIPINGLILINGQF
jgi:hypothetical protein